MNHLFKKSLDNEVDMRVNSNTQFPVTSSTLLCHLHGAVGMPGPHTVVHIWRTGSNAVAAPSPRGRDP